MQKILLISDENSLNETNKILEESSNWFVSEISEPNNKGEWLVVIDDEPDDEDYKYDK